MKEWMKVADENRGELENKIENGKMNGEGVESDHLRRREMLDVGTEEEEEKEGPDAERKSRQIGGDNVELAPRRRTA